MLGWVLGGLLALFLGAGAGFLIWANTGVMAAEPDPLAAVRADSGIELVDEGTAWVMRPTDASDGTGLVFIPGAKVAPEGYAATFQALVDDGTTVVITKPPLNLAILDLRPLSRFTELVPEVSDWAVGGHSLGGVKACQLVGNAGVDRLILFASYCSNDISQTGYDVLSISGTADGLSTPAKIEAAWPLLPADAAAFVLDGGSHASFGAYGPQAGDGTPTMPAEEAHARISSVVRAFLTGG